MMLRCDSDFGRMGRVVGILDIFPALAITFLLDCESDEMVSDNPDLKCKVVSCGVDDLLLLVDDDDSDDDDCCIDSASFFLSLEEEDFADGWT